MTEHYRWVARSLPVQKMDWNCRGGGECLSLSPTQDTKHKVEDEEGPKDDQAHKVYPGQLIPHGILHLGRESAHFLRACRCSHWSWEEGAQAVSMPCVHCPPHPVQDVSPAFHGDALKDCQHGEEEVIKVGDATVGPWPAPSAFSLVHCAGTSRA